MPIINECCVHKIALPSSRRRPGRPIPPQPWITATRGASLPGAWLPRDRVCKRCADPMCFGWGKSFKMCDWDVSAKDLRALTDVTVVHHIANSQRPASPQRAARGPLLHRSELDASPSGLDYVSDRVKWQSVQIKEDIERSTQLQTCNVCTCFHASANGDSTL